MTTLNERFVALELDQIDRDDRATPVQDRSVLTSVAVVVPTYNEAANVRPLVAMLREVLDGLDHTCEIVFVDDSDDTTPDEVRDLEGTDGVPVRLIHRLPGRRTGGLGGAVTEGIRGTAADVVVVMDGDLQHPPSTVPALVAALRDHDVAVASRYVSGGSAGGLDGAVRRFVSNGSTSLAKLLFPRRLRGCSDPMTGFFALRRDSIDHEALEPMGFKILLEILARHDLRITEVPFTFGERHAGESKASLRQGLTFVWQLLNLRLGRAGRFAVVGASGLAVNLGVMAVLLASGLGSGLGYVVASLVAAEVSILWNFLLQERLVFSDLVGRHGRMRRARQAIGYNNLEALLRLPLLVLAVDGLHAPELLSQAVLIVLAFTARFTVMTRLVYRRRPSEATSPSTVATLAPVPHRADPHERM